MTSVSAFISTDQASHGVRGVRLAGAAVVVHPVLVLDAVDDGFADEGWVADNLDGVVGPEEVDDGAGRGRLRIGPGLRPQVGRGERVAANLALVVQQREDRGRSVLRVALGLRGQFAVPEVAGVLVARWVVDVLVAPVHGDAGVERGLLVVDLDLLAHLVAELRQSGGVSWRGCWRR